MASMASNITPWPLAHTPSPSRGAARTSGAGEALGRVFRAKVAHFSPALGSGWCLSGVVALSTALCDSFSAVPSR